MVDDEKNYFNYLRLLFCVTKYISDYVAAENAEDSLQAEINSSLQSSKKASRTHSKLENELTDSDNDIPMMGSSSYRSAADLSITLVVTNDERIKGAVSRDFVCTFFSS